MRIRSFFGRRAKVFVLALSFAACGSFLWAQGQDRKPDQDQSLEELLRTKISTASKYEQMVGEAPASVTVINQDEIERFGYRTLQDVFASVPGFSVSYDKQYSYLGVRGFGRPTDYNNRVLLLVNGLQINEVVFGAALVETAFGIDLADVERIEIVRGPGSTLYGTGAMLAVINVITKKGASLGGLSMSAETGSFGRLKGKAAYGTSLKNNSDLFVSGRWASIDGQDLYYKEYDSPLTNNGLAQDLDWDKYRSLFATFAYKGFSLQAYSSSRKKGIPTGSWGTDFNSPDNESYDAQKFLELRYEHDWSSRLQMTSRVFFNEYHYYTFLPYSGVPFGDSADNDLLGGEIRFLWDTASKNRLILGLEYRDSLKASYRYGEPGIDYFNGDFPQSVFSFYAQDEYSFSRALTLTLGFRNDYYSTIRNTFVPRASLVYHLFDRTTLKILIAEAFRAPNVWESNYTENEETGYMNQKVNPNLRAERIDTLELAVEHKLTAELFGTLSLYSFRMKGLIDLGLDPTDNFYQYENIGTTRSRGLELGLNARFNSGLLGYANYSYQDTRDSLLGNRLTNSPQHLVKAGVSFSVFRFGYLGLQILHESERLTLYEAKTKPFFLANLNLTTSRLFGHLKVSFLINNLFDTQYAYPGGYEHLQDAILQDGRNFIVRLKYLF